MLQDSENSDNQRTVVILINATKQFWYALQNPEWGNK